jgi:xanthine dehydrogenase accessory factor
MRFFERVAELERERVPFALAIVVSRRAPVSSHVGDRAIVFADGGMEGFVGGSCSRDVVRRHGVESIRSGQPRLLHIRPEPAGDDAAGAGEGEHVFVPMSCASEGATDVYLEPHLPARRLIVAGFTPVAQALAQAASALDYEVVRAVDEHEAAELAGAAEHVVTLRGLRSLLVGLSAAERNRTAAVVASLGHYDETALDELLDADLPFVGLVASRKRAARVLGVLAQQGRSTERLATVRNPVGLDIGARSAADVAVSILAEIIATPWPALAPSGPRSEAAGVSPAIALDPICRMEVEVEDARHTYEVNGRTYYFCCAGCRAAFAADPAAALAATGHA